MQKSPIECINISVTDGRWNPGSTETAKLPLTSSETEFHPKGSVLQPLSTPVILLMCIVPLKTTGLPTVVRTTLSWGLGPEYQKNLNGISIYTNIKAWKKLWHVENALLSCFKWKPHLMDLHVNIQKLLFLQDHTSLQRIFNIGFLEKWALEHAVLVYLELCCASSLGVSGTPLQQKLWEAFFLKWSCTSCTIPVQNAQRMHLFEENSQWNKSLPLLLSLSSALV